MPKTKDQRDREYNKAKAYKEEKKSTACADCGIQYPPYVMDFDHREGETKMYAVGLTGHRGFHKMVAEIEKCDVVCSNCHRIRTHNRKQRLRSEQDITASS